jgi:RNA polymerase sigma-70 factor (ECF subfamily)
MAKPNNEKNSWFRKTVVNLESPLLNYAFKIISRRESSEEIVQEGFLKLWAQEYPRFENHYPKAWLYKICRNMAIDYLRREKRIDLENDLENILSRPCVSESLFDASVIIKEISKLSKIEQEVLVLRFSDELSYKEISDVVGITPSHVGVKIHEGLQAIRGVILKELSEEN